MTPANPKGQRRNLAVLFSDLCDSTRISGSLEPEQFAALLEQLRGLYEVIVSRHGGMIVRIDGDGVICAFGYPAALDDAGRRATEAALDLHAGAAELDQSFAGPNAAIRLHSGVHTGIVLVREGDMVRGRIEILGDTTNIAARLCDFALADQIVVSEASLGADRHFFVAEAGADVPLKGRRDSIPALLIKGRDEAATRFAARSRRGMAPFCGRDHEFARLGDMLAEVIGGQSQTVILAGAAGIGKTRFLSEFLDAAAASEIAIHRGYCEAYLGARPLQPFEQIAQSLGGSTDDARTKMLRWARETAAEPAIMAIDDWQWADDASHALLSELTQSRSSGLLVILACRTDGSVELYDEGYVCIELGPLSAADAEQAISGLLPWVDPFRTERIRLLSGGSPLFIEELCHAQTTRLPSQGDGDSNVWLDTMVQARFLDLPEHKADLVRIASVIGHIVPLGLFAAVTGIGAGDAVFAELSASDFLYPGEVTGTLRFKHALTRDAIYRMVGLEDRQRLHGLVVDRLEALAAQEDEEEYVDGLAYHCFAAQQFARALPYAVAAGDAALAARALDRAQAHYQVAFNCYSSISNRSASGLTLDQLVTRYGRACVIDPSREQLPTLAEMVGLARSDGDSKSLALALYWQGTVHFGLGDASIAIGLLEEALDRASRGGHGGLAAQAQASLGACRFDQGASDQAMELLQSAASKMLSELSGSRTPAYLYAIANIAQIQADRGEFEAAGAIFAEIDQVIGSDEALVISSLMTQRATVLIWQGQFEQAARCGRAAESHGILARSRQNTMFGKALRSYADFRSTRDPLAVASLKEALEWLDASPYRHRISLFYGWGADAMARSDRPAEARFWAARAFVRSRQGDGFGKSSAARAMARVCAGTGKCAAIERFLRLAERVDRERHSAWSLKATELCRAELQSVRTNR